MKKIFYFLYVLVIISSFFAVKALAASAFPTALKTCESFSQQGSVMHNSGYYKIDVSLSKDRNKCTYKEKITHDADWDLLKCSFDMSIMSEIADSMQKFNDIFKTDIAKNPVFGFKMSTNSEVLNTYLVDPKYCSITTSRKK